jgi:hypothetical protein
VVVMTSIQGQGQQASVVRFSLRRQPPSSKSPLASGARGDDSR